MKIQKQLTKPISNVNLNSKIEVATAGLDRYLKGALLTRLSKENAKVVAQYIDSMKTEINPSDNYRANTIKTLMLFSEFLHNKRFSAITRDNILLYLDSYRRTDAADPLHKWIGTYNMKLVQLVRFFKWIYCPNPEVKSKKRKIPPVVQNIPQLKRKEQSIYQPSDMWTQDDDLIFIKFCPNKRDRAYHIVARDTSCRPHELVRAKIRDVVFKMIGEHQVAEIMVNGKTGTRMVPLINSIPYLKTWLNEHPQKGNSDALLFPSFQRSHFCRKMTNTAIHSIYRRYKTVFFTQLLTDPNVPPEDKIKIRDLLKKPWNPYIRRHSALTEKSLLLPDHVLKQHAGWTARSQMHVRYVHYMTNQSNESLYQAYGIVKKGNDIEQLKPKTCPHCGEANEKGNDFCSNTECNLALSLKGYNDSLKEQEHTIESIVEKKIQQILGRVDLTKFPKA